MLPAARPSALASIYSIASVATRATLAAVAASGAAILPVWRRVDASLCGGRTYGDGGRHLLDPHALCRGVLPPLSHEEAHGQPPRLTRPRQNGPRARRAPSEDDHRARFATTAGRGGGERACQPLGYACATLVVRLPLSAAGAAVERLGLGRGRGSSHSRSEPCSRPRPLSCAMGPATGRWRW